MIDFENIGYLSTGNPKQQLAYQVLTKHAVFEKLQSYQPILTGTIPISIDIPLSDLDIACCWKDQNEFIRHLQQCFATETGFRLRQCPINGQHSIIANFKLDDFELEIFGQQTPSKQQYAYRHLLIEQQILSEKDEAFRQAIIELKLQGYKTEPAFAKMLHLQGDPHLALLNYGEQP